MYFLVELSQCSLTFRPPTFWRIWWKALDSLCRNAHMTKLSVQTFHCYSRLTSVLQALQPLLSIQWATLSLTLKLPLGEKGGMKLGNGRWAKKLCDEKFNGSSPEGRFQSLGLSRTDPLRQALLQAGMDPGFRVVPFRGDKWLSKCRSPAVLLGL